MTIINFSNILRMNQRVLAIILFEDYFCFWVPRALAKELYKTKNKNKNDKLVNVIKSGLIDLKNKIEENISKWNKNWKTR